MTTEHNLKLESYDPGKLNHFHENARIGDVDAIAESIERNGIYKPVVVNRGTKTGRPNEVLAGNHTVKAVRQLGWTELPVVWVDVDDDAARRIVLADNRTNDLARYDDGALLRLVQKLDDGDLAGTGFTESDLLDLMESVDTGGYGAPGSADIAEPGDDEYQEQWGVIVMAKDEPEQALIYDELKAQGYVVKVVTV